MAVPKRKTSKSRKNMRRANWKLTVPTLVTCKICSKKIRPHTVCKECGCYKGDEVI